MTIDLKILKQLGWSDDLLRAVEDVARQLPPAAVSSYGSDRIEAGQSLEIVSGSLALSDAPPVGSTSIRAPRAGR